jgi:hypothetical protein
VRIVTQWEEKIIGDYSYLPPKVEQEIKSHVLKLKQYMSGQTQTDMRSLEYQVSASKEKGNGRTQLV